MFRRIILTALAAGLISGVFVWGAHMVKTTPLILAAEVYDDGISVTCVRSPSVSTLMLSRQLRLRTVSSKSVTGRLNSCCIRVSAFAESSS